MSKENVEAIRKATDAISRGDKAAWLAFNDADVVMIPARDWPENSPTRGPEAVWDFYAQEGEVWEEGASGTMGLGEVIEAGEDQVVVNVRNESHGRAGGAAIEFRNQALEATGLSE